MPFEALPPFRLHEVSKYHTEVWISGSAVFAMYMNKAKYAALPADVRQVLDETTSRQWYWKQVGESWDKAEVNGRQVVAAHKNEIYTLPEEERRRWREAAQGIGEKWAADLRYWGLSSRRLVLAGVRSAQTCRPCRPPSGKVSDERTAHCRPGFRCPDGTDSGPCPDRCGNGTRWRGWHGMGGGVAGGARHAEARAL